MFKIFTSIFFITMVLIVYSCKSANSSDYIEYVPVELVVERGEHILQKNQSLLIPDHIKAMIEILQKYDEDFKIIEGKLYIKKALMQDLDTLQNYTFKAEVLRKTDSQ